MAARKVDIVIISDVHLGTYGCHAEELLCYLKSISPRILVLNGDIFDGWNFKKNYFPTAHLAVLQELLKMLSETKIYYITGNHDEILRQFSDITLNNFVLLDKLVLPIDGRKAWIFHGDVFDISMRYTKFVAKLGGIGYDWLIYLNHHLNKLLKAVGRPPYSFSQKIKQSVKKAVKFVDDFEQTAIDLGIEQEYDYVICGHIHQPKIKEIKTEKGSITYLNSGDWVENLTALEYNEKKWLIYEHHRQEVSLNGVQKESVKQEIVEEIAVL